MQLIKVKTKCVIKYLPVEIPFPDIDKYSYVRVKDNKEPIYYVKLNQDEYNLVLNENSKKVINKEQFNNEKRI